MGSQIKYYINAQRKEERGTRNKEGGTRNKEGGTRNKEQGTRNENQDVSCISLKLEPLYLFS